MKEYKHDCSFCGLDKGCLSPYMPVTGEGRKKILIIGEGPGQKEDEENIQFIGQSGQFLRKSLVTNRIRIEKDCWKTNAVRCRTPNNRTPSIKEMNCCRNHIFQAIDELRPEKIFTFGKTALQTLMQGQESVTDIEKWIGRKIPNQKWSCYIYPMYHPAYLIRNSDDVVLYTLFEEHLIDAVYDEPNLGCFSSKIFEGITTITHSLGAIIFLQGINSFETDVAIDIETIGLSPYTEKAKILSIAFSFKGQTVSFPLFDDKEFLRELRRFLQGKNRKIAHNLKFEDKWIYEKLGYRVKNWIWDTMIGAHTLDNRPGITGLKFQAGINYGYFGYDAPIKKYIKNMDECPQEEMLLYNAKDALFTFMLYEQQSKELKEHKGFSLFMEGITALSQIEINGIQINEEYYKKRTTELLHRIQHLKKEIQGNKEITSYWKKEFNPRSSLQLRELLFNHLGIKPKKETIKGNPSTDISVLETINHPLVRKIARMRKLEKIQGTFLANIMNNANKGVLHPSFDLHTTRTYRSSSSNPNFQNIPKRDETAQKIIRSGIIPRKGNILMEVDYSGIEVRISACYHKDPVMIEYIYDPTSDMHRDQAKELFLKDDVSKEERYLAKNGFVFPEFYGSYFIEIAPRLWKDMPLETRQHLGNKGITNYNKFEAHVENVESKFWNERFIVYNEWKREQWKKYQENGYIEMFTGFKASGLMRRNVILNYGIQGCAFHCLLWSLIHIQEYIKTAGYTSRIIGQIHDSIIFDIVPDELVAIHCMVQQIMCDEIRKEWEWIIVPLQIETMISEVDGNWFEMKKYENQEKNVQL